MPYRTIRQIGKLGPSPLGATISHDPGLGEYRVRFHRAGVPLPAAAAADYFTDSLDDAMATASTELERMASTEPPQAG